MLYDIDGNVHRLRSRTKRQKMKANSSGTLLWNQRLTEAAEEGNSSFIITLIVPVVWMISLSKLHQEQRNDVRSRIGDSLLSKLCQNPEWDNTKFELLRLEIVDMHKDYIRVKIILAKK